MLAAVLARKGGVRGRGGPDAISWTLKVAYSLAHLFLDSCLFRSRFDQEGVRMCACMSRMFMFRRLFLSFLSRI